MMDRRNGALAVLLAGLFGAVAAGSGWRAAVMPPPAGTPEFLQPGSCYRLTFPVESPPNYKILEHLDGGWVKAEVDAGSGRAQRRPLWINTAQIVSASEARCAD